MSEAYQVELLHIRLGETIESLVQVLTECELTQSNRSRYEHLLREVGSFRFAIWGDKVPRLKRGGNK